MDIFAIILTGLALAMDASAITVANCTTYGKKLTRIQEWSMPLAFTIFQILMPVIGFYIGSVFAEYVSSFSGYLTAGVFFILASKIVYDNIKEIREHKKPLADEGDGEKIVPQKQQFSFAVLIIQAVSTSIDALAIGVTYAMIFSSPFIPALIIGAVTFLTVAVALLLGKYLGNVLGKYAGWIGAGILFILSVKSLIEAII